MGNLNCSQSSQDSDTQPNEYLLDRRQKPSSPIKIEEIQGEDIQPLVTTVRRPQTYIERILKDPKQKKKKTQREMGEFIQGLLEKGKRSDKYKEKKRKQKLVLETRRQKTKHLSFNLDKFLLDQRQFLEKRNTSLEKSRQTLYASRSKEETHYPKINQNSRRIAIQVSSRNITNKKLIVLKDPKTKSKRVAKKLEHDSSKGSRQKEESRFPSNKLNSSSKKANESYLRKKLRNQFQNCCGQLGIQQTLNYLQFTEVLTMMNFSNGEMSQRAMLLQGWNLLAGERMNISCKLAFSFILSLFGLELNEAAYYSLKTDCKSVDNDSPTRIKQDLDITFLTNSNEKPSQLHQDRLDQETVQYIREQYKPLCYNKLVEAKGYSSALAPICMHKGKEEQENTNGRYPSSKNDQFSASYRNKIIRKAERMHILKPRFINRELSGYEVNKLWRSIQEREAQERQIENQIEQVAQCTFHPTISHYNSHGRDFNRYFAGSKEKPAPYEKMNSSLQSTFAKMKFKPQPLLQIEVSIGQKVEKITVYEGDDTTQLADEFLQRNSLPLAFREKLITMISQGLPKI